MTFIRFLVWFTLIPWLIYTLRAPFIIWHDMELRYGFLGTIIYFALWVLAFYIVIPVCFLIGFMHSWKWVFDALD